MNIIVFTNILEGHHLEYIHHVYEIALRDNVSRYIFLLPFSFTDIKGKFLWETSDHIRFQFFEDFKTSTGNVFSRLLGESYQISRLVGRVAKENRADVIYSNHLIVFVPFAPLYISVKTKLIGVIYRIYLHDIENRSALDRLLDKVKYQIISRMKVFYKALILNDSQSADKLNKIYHTNKFVSIADPYVPISTDHIEDIRSQYGIDRNKKMFIHFGAMNSNKATIEILESIRALSDKEKGDYCFFFAGKVSTGIKERFYHLCDDLKDEVQIIVKDDFCSYDFFASLCIACDAILTPYRRTAQSSGLIGYASQFGKPVIAVNKGLLGQLVREYELGILIEDNDPDSLMAGYRAIAEGNYKKPTQKYCEQNCIEKFQEVIKSSLV